MPNTRGQLEGQTIAEQYPKALDALRAHGLSETDLYSGMGKWVINWLYGTNFSTAGFDPAVRDSDRSGGALFASMWGLPSQGSLKGQERNIGAESILNQAPGSVENYSFSELFINFLTARDSSNFPSFSNMTALVSKYTF